jgi:molybdopterin-guanine dinucleotide biosynthesis protein A
MCVYDHFHRRIAEMPLYGLVLAGGRSTRMKMDKAALDYHGKPQMAHCHDLLRGFCRDVFVSVRSDQADDPVSRRLPQIHDRFVGFGPMGGILSALKEHPEAAWLVLACDLPFVDEVTLRALVRERNPYKLATAFVSPRDGFPEPLCAIYEPKSVFWLLQFLGLGIHCPRKILINSDTHLLKPPTPQALANANSPDEYAAALATIEESRGAAR